MKPSSVHMGSSSEDVFPPTLVRLLVLFSTASLSPTSAYIPPPSLDFLTCCCPLAGSHFSFLLLPPIFYTVLDSFSPSKKNIIKEQMKQCYHRLKYLRLDIVIIQSNSIIQKKIFNVSCSRLEIL